MRIGFCSVPTACFTEDEIFCFFFPISKKSLCPGSSCSCLDFIWDLGVSNSDYAFLYLRALYFAVYFTIFAVWLRVYRIYSAYLLPLNSLEPSSSFSVYREHCGIVVDQNTDSKCLYL